MAELAGTPFRVARCMHRPGSDVVPGMRSLGARHSRGSVVRISCSPHVGTGCSDRPRLRCASNPGAEVFRVYPACRGDGKRGGGRCPPYAQRRSGVGSHFSRSRGEPRGVAASRGPARACVRPAGAPGWTCVCPERSWLELPLVTRLSPADHLWCIHMIARVGVVLKGPPIIG